MLIPKQFQFKVKNVTSIGHLVEIVMEFLHMMMVFKL